MRKYIGILFCISIGLAFACSSSHDSKKQQQVKTELTNTEVDSIDLLTASIKLDSTNYQLFLRRAVFYVEKGKIDPALRDLMYALELNRDDPKIYLLLSDIYFLLEQPHNSIDALIKVLKIDPENETAYLKLAEIYLLKGEYTNAQQYTEKVIKQNSENAEAYYLKAISRIELGDSIDALNNLKISARLDTMNYMAYMQLAAIYDAKQEKLSIDYYLKALVSRPKDEKSMYLLGTAYQNNGLFDQALDTYQQLTSIYPNHINGHYNTGYIYLVELEDFPSAVQAFEEAISINGAFVQAVYNLGRTYEAMGLFDKARSQYRVSLQLLPNYPLAIKGLNRLDEMME